jgi:hypothetical protein
MTSQATMFHPTSYDMPNGSGVHAGGEYNYWDGSYTGSGAKNTDGAMLSGGLGALTDGIIATSSWEVGTSTVENAQGTGQYVGWTGGDPTITFHFANLVNINNITFYVDNPFNNPDGNPGGGVAAPLSFTIDGLLKQPTNPAPVPANGPLAMTVKDLGLDNVNELSVTLNRDTNPGRFWVFMSEITFSDGLPSPVPEPSTLLLLGAGLAGVALLRKRRAA